MLYTQRLRIVPLTHDQLLYFKNDQKALAKSLNTNYLERHGDPATAKDVEEAIEFWLKGTAENPDQFEWYTSWEIILQDENVSIGGIGFTGLPDEQGKTMVGYGLDVRFHGRGIATEALGALTQWAFLHRDLKIIMADTPLNHIASHKVLQKNSFCEDHRDDELIHWCLKKSE